MAEQGAALVMNEHAMFLNRQFLDITILLKINKIKNIT